MNHTSANGGLDLNSCEREPIRIPGAIQPHGALIAFEASTGAILHTSENLGQFISINGLPVQDRFLADVLGDQSADSIVQNIRRTTLGGITSPISLQLHSAPGATGHLLDATVHVQRGVAILELEMPSDSDPNWMPVFTDAMQRMRESDSTEHLLSLMAGRIKRMTGFDRVMAYRFDEAWNGQVIAERCEPGMESFLGLWYPASDIPAQARELYVTNLVRYIADINYQPVPVRPQLDMRSQQPLDMSYAQLRSVSPMHLQYLKNMGVGATLVLSIVVDGKLWGLVSCHHRQPRLLSLHLRSSIRLLALSLGYMLSAQLKQQANREREQLSELQVGILKSFNQPHVELADIVEGISTHLLRLGGASSGVLWHDNELIPFGQPTPAGFDAWVVNRAREALLHTSGAPVFWQKPPAEDAAQMKSAGICGLGAISLESFAQSGLVWLRPEWVRDVHWGGNPDKAMNLDQDANGNPILTPRNSFAKFLIEAHGESRPWDDSTRNAMMGLAGLQESLILRESMAKVALSDRRFRSLVALQSDCYWQTDTEGRIMVLSRDLGFGSGSYTGQSMRVLYEGRSHPQEVDSLMRPLHEGKSFRHIIINSADPSADEFFSHQINGEPIRDRSGVMVGMHGTISDVTQRRLDEIRLMEAERQAHAASDAKGRFLAMMSHEIRTPMNGVMGYLELLERMELAPDAKRYIKSAQAAGSVLSRVLNDVLDLSRIESGALELLPRPVLLQPVLDEIMSLVTAEADRKGLRLIAAFNAPSTRAVRLDDLRLRQILLNLLNNAIKFTESGSVTLDVQTQPSATDKVRLRFAVRDTGIGMTEGQLGRVLEPFHQADSSITRRFGGSGLGLSISQRLLLLMGSPGLVIESEPGKGTVFAFEIECEQPNEDEAVVTPSDPAIDSETPPSGMRVLLVEDNPTNVEVALAILDQFAADVSVALNGEEALSALDQLGDRVDVILMDMQMPVMDGLTATREIRKRPDHANTPILALTANAFTSDRELCLQAGMNGFLSKPLGIQQMANALAQAARLKRVVG